MDDREDQFGGWIIRSKTLSATHAQKHSAFLPKLTFSFWPCRCLSENSEQAGEIHKPGRVFSQVNEPFVTSYQRVLDLQYWSTDAACVHLAACYRVFNSAVPLLGLLELQIFSCYEASWVSGHAHAEKRLDYVDTDWKNHHFHSSNTILLWDSKVTESSLKHGCEPNQVHGSKVSLWLKQRTFYSPLQNILSPSFCSFFSLSHFSLLLSSFFLSIRPFFCSPAGA